MTLPWHLPVVLGAVLLAPAGATLGLSGGSPVVPIGTVVAPAGATPTLTGSTPEVDVGSTITPAGATPTLTGGTPSVTATTNIFVNPATGSLTLTGGTLTFGAVNPIGVTLTLTGGTPTVTNTLLITPAAATCALSVGTPQVILPTGPISPDGVVLGLYAGNPTLSVGKFYDSFRVAAISMADYVQPAYTGTGARIYRAATSVVYPYYTVAATPALLPANTFDTIDICTADISINLTNGGFTVQTPGWYQVKARCDSLYALSSASTVPSVFGLVLYKNGSPGALGEPFWGVEIPGAYYSGPSAVFGDFDVKLVAGDTVQIGNYVDTANMYAAFEIQGEATGSITYAMITLSNRAG